VLFEVFRHSAAQVPQQPAVIDGDRVETYADLITRTEGIARGMATQRITRFGCALDAPADTVAAVAASSAVGVEACLYPRELDLARLADLTNSFEHRVLVVDRAWQLDSVEMVTLDQLMTTAGPGLSTPESAPVMILTTGTTGAPKGARHDWSRLVRAVRKPDERPGTRWLLAYNLNQFAGIQILLHALTSAATLVAPSSRRADDVLHAIDAHRVTHVSGTPTFWRLLVGRLDAAQASKLPLMQITLGGEAAPEGLIEHLRELFPSARISHVYAGTEFGSAVAVSDGRSGLPLSVLERGDDAEVQLRIVDGELQIRSRVGMLGYHGVGDNESDWRATGDLVEVRHDRIQFVGRTTEIINVGGAKVHPLPVEELVCGIEGVEIAAVYGRPNPITGQIVSVDVVSKPGTRNEDIESRIREACQSLPQASRPRRVRFVSKLEIQGNKLMRQEAR